MMMSPLNENQARALATLIATLRPGPTPPAWDAAGVFAALRQAATRGTAVEVAHAAITAAANPANRTPAVIPLAGPHWSTGATSTNDAIPRPDDARCDEHLWERATNCRACRAEELAAPDATYTQRIGGPVLPPERIRHHAEQLRRIAAGATPQPTEDVDADVRKLQAGDRDD